jgi:hypothetical protein
MFPIITKQRGEESMQNPQQATQPTLDGDLKQANREVL